MYTVQVTFGCAVYMYGVHVRCISTIQQYTYEWFRPSLEEKEDTVMSLKRWFYRYRHPNRVARTLDRGTAALYALSKRKFGRLGR